jgi:hypothetical protein
MRTPHPLTVVLLAQLFAAPTLSAQALAEKALTTAANPAPALSLPQVNMPHATVPGTSMHSYSARHTTSPAPTHATIHRSNTKTAHKSSRAGSTPAHVTYRRIQ